MHGPTGLIRPNGSAWAMNITGPGILQESMRCLAQNLYTEASTKHSKNGEFVPGDVPKRPGIPHLGHYFTSNRKTF